MSYRIFLAAALAALASACYSPNIPNGTQKCAAGNTCAAGYECGADGLCYKKGQLPNIGPDMAVSVDMTMQCSQADCKAPKPICDPDSKQCVPCLTDTHCPDGQLCKNKQCIPGCSMAHGCGDGGMCDPNGMCKICKVDGDCGGNTPRCDTDSGRCVTCLPQMGQVADNCTNGEFCKKVNADYQCVKGCKLDGDCMGGKCCANVCVNLQADGMNCGACGKACMGGACCAGSCTDTASDIANCGMCGKTCTGGHAMWSCMMGGCNITGCQGSYKDCNMDPMDGCEANTAADAMNCTACGMKCNLQNAVAGCANGCFVQSCNMGFGNCDNMAANGCEANVAIDKTNCGMCGKVCANVPNGFPGCANSMCIVGGCINGYDDCDMQVGNGCESKVDADPNNCGGCGMKCPMPANASASCANAVCGLGMCNAGFSNCDNMAGNGCEAPTATDKNNCGGCGKVCSNNHIANPTCGNSVCNGACTAGFGDCNNNKLTDGCEADFQNDNNNCNGCGNVCMNGLVCKSGVCAMGMIGQLNGTQSNNVTYGGTHNGVFADPVTNKVYYFPSYSNGMTGQEYNDIASFVANPNVFRAIPLASGYEGTYHAALNGFFYYNTYNTNTIVKVRTSDGALIASRPFVNAGHTNQSSFQWGGYSDMCFYVDAGNKLYMLWAPPAGNIQIDQLNPNNLATLQNWAIARPKLQTGFAFLVNGVFYIGFNYSQPAINATFVLNGSVYNPNYVNSLTPQAGDYITDTYWNPGNNTLFEQTNGHTIIYPNVK